RNLDEFEAVAREVKDKVGAEDFLELDAFLNLINRGRPPFNGDPTPVTLPVPSPEYIVRFEALLRSLRERGLHFPEELVSNYLLALQTKRFVILTGISGTGKTQLAL